MLRNIPITCPIIATCVNNSSNHRAVLFIPGGDEIMSGKETMQGDPPAVFLYVLDSLLLLDTLLTQNKKHAAYVDNLTCSSKLRECAIWWHKISKLGPKIGFFPKEI